MIGNPNKYHVGHLLLYQLLLFMHLTKHEHWKHQKERKVKRAEVRTAREKKKKKK